MAFDAGTVKGELDLDARKFLAALDKVERRLDGVESELKQTRSAAQSFAKGLAVLAAGVIAAVAAFRAFSATFRGLTDLVQSSLQAASDYEVVIRKLSTSLQLAGNAGVGGLVERLREWAGEVQKATGLSDNLVLSIAQQLTTFGVAEKDLKEFTEAVLNYAAATGQDALNGARLFGKSLSGVLGELSEAIPALKGTTAEALAAGEAFKFAGRAFQGFAEEVGQTSEGIQNRLEASFGDFQKQFGQTLAPAVDGIKLQLITAFEELTAAVAANREQIQQTFSEIAIGTLDAFVNVIDLFLRAREVAVTFVVGVREILPSLATDFASLRVTVNEFLVDFAKFLEFITGNVGVFGTFVNDATKSLAEARRESDALVSAFAELKIEGAQWKREVKESNETIKNGIAPTVDRIKEAVGKTADLFKKAGDNALQTAGAIGAASSNMGDLVQKALEGRRAIAAAAREADQLEESLEGAAAASGRIGGGGGGGSTSPSAGRQGGPVGLALGNFTESLGTLREQQRLLQQSAFNGGFDFIERAQRGVVENVRNIANAQLDQAFREFTEEVLRSLDSAGILDPDERSRVVRERIAEAQRLGVLPKQRSAGAAGTGIANVGVF